MDYAQRWLFHTDVRSIAFETSHVKLFSAGVSFQFAVESSMMGGSGTVPIHVFGMLESSIDRQGTPRAEVL